MPPEDVGYASAENDNALHVTILDITPSSFSSPFSHPPPLPLFPLPPCSHTSPLTQTSIVLFLMLGATSSSLGSTACSFVGRRLQEAHGAASERRRRVVLQRQRVRSRGGNPPDELGVG